jgi:two-component system sensor histidine kinase KdpD
MAPPADEPPRPDPDALLALAAREGRGRLKVFLGAAPGVGKTFEMLLQARRRQLGGADVVAGLIETHGRAETTSQIGPLELLPLARIDYRGQQLEEFDLDAALARHPQILLLDELAHTNAPGSRHPKRWQDVAELRQSGIEVWTTMNVQHLESLSDAVARITGVRVQETVPDQVLTEADAVELVDIPPSELLDRLRQGRVYRPEQASRALKGFFREGNLAALRELALRRTADRVDADVSGYMRAYAIPGPWPAGDRVIALVGADPAAEGVVRQARRIADALRAPLVALHVEQPGAALAGDPAAALRLAETLGAEVETVVALDVPSAILTLARERNATHLVIGRGRPGFWRRLTGRTLSAALLRRATEYTLHLVPDPAVPVRPARQPREWPAWLGWAMVPACVAAATGIGFTTDGVVAPGALGMVYLAAIVAIAVTAGPLQAMFGAILSFLCWNFLFLPPRYELAIATAEDVVGVVVFSLVALLLVGTTGGLGRSVQAARARLFSLRRLVEFSRRLGASGSLNDLLDTVAQEAERVTGAPACVLMPLPGGPPGEAPEPVVRAATPLEATPDEASMAAARWALAHDRPTGAGTDTLPSAAWQFRPMRSARGTLGLVGLQSPGGGLDAERDRTLAVLLDQAAVAIERAQLMEEHARGTARAETEVLRTALLTSLGHDLRTPLTAIRGAAETLQAAGPQLPNRTRADLLATVVEETARMARFLNNILDMVRMEAGEITPKREPVDIVEALDGAAARAERGSGRLIQRHLPASLPRPRLDPVLLDQILGNLLDNALKFSASSGMVEVGAQRAGAEVLLWVQDNGPGIAARDLSRIFDPFFRAGRTDRVAAGSGLGLAICRGLAAAMGGRIAAESPVQDGIGTRISLRFPA